MDEKRKHRFKFVKTPGYKTFHVDGFWGSYSANGQFSIDLYNQKHEIPEEQIYEVQDGNAMPLDVQQPSYGIREIEACIVLDLNLAIILKDWLSERIGEAKKLQKENNQKQ